MLDFQISKVQNSRRDLLSGVEKIDSRRVFQGVKYEGLYLASLGAVSRQQQVSDFGG